MHILFGDLCGNECKTFQVNYCIMAIILVLEALFSLELNFRLPCCWAQRKKLRKSLLQKYLFSCRIVEENAYLCIRNHETLSIEIKKPLWCYNQKNLVRSARCKLFSRPLQRWAADAALVCPARRKLKSNMISPRFQATFPLFPWRLFFNIVAR